MQLGTGRVFGAGAAALGAMMLAACGGSEVGDPCVPTKVPNPCPASGGNCGFEPSESFLETSSVQCRSRVCLVFRADGDPNFIRNFNCSDAQIQQCENNGQKCCSGQCVGDNVNCVRYQSASTQRGEWATRVHCTCRCSGEQGQTCNCPSGYGCQRILDFGGPGIAGSYCVDCDTLCAESQGAQADLELSPKAMNQCNCESGGMG